MSADLAIHMKMEDVNGGSAISSACFGKEESLSLFVEVWPIKMDTAQNLDTPRLG